MIIDHNASSSIVLFVRILTRHATAVIGQIGHVVVRQYSSIFAKDRISLIQKLSKYCSTRKQRATDGLEKQRKKILNNNNKIVVLSTLPYKN